MKTLEEEKLKRPRGFDACTRGSEKINSSRNDLGDNESINQPINLFDMAPNIRGRVERYVNMEQTQKQNKLNEAYIQQYEDLQRNRRKWAMQIVVRRQWRYSR